MAIRAISAQQIVQSPPSNMSGSTSGSAQFMPYTTANMKRVLIYLNALLGTATYTFPTPFTNTPQILSSNGPGAAIVTSLNTTSVTVTGATTTGFIELVGI